MTSPAQRPGSHSAQKPALEPTPSLLGLRQLLSQLTSAAAPRQPVPQRASVAPESSAFPSRRRPSPASARSRAADRDQARSRFDTALLLRARAPCPSPPARPRATTPPDAFRRAASDDP